MSVEIKLYFFVKLGIDDVQLQSLLIESRFLGLYVPSKGPRPKKNVQY